MNARAQSEALGYMLVFSLVVTSAGVVYAGGIGGLQDAQRAEQFDNMGRAFDVLEANVADIHRQGAPSRATELHLSGGTLGFGPPIEISVRATEVGNASNNATFSMNPRPLVYSAQDDRALVYVAGAVIRTDGEVSVIRDPPEFRVESAQTVIPFIVTYQKGDESFGGRSAVRVIGTNLGNELDGSFTPTNDTAVEITVSSPRANAWKRYFERQGYTAVDASVEDGTVTYRFTTERLYVYQTVIEFNLER